MHKETPIKESNKETAMRTNNESIKQLKTSKHKETDMQEDGDRRTGRQTERRTDRRPTDRHADR